MIIIQTVTSNVQSAPASLQTFIDTSNCVLDDRGKYSMVYIPNVFCGGHRQVPDFWIIVRLTENFWSPCIFRCCTSFAAVRYPARVCRFSLGLFSQMRLAFFQQCAIVSTLHTRSTGRTLLSLCMICSWFECVRLNGCPARHVGQQMWLVMATFIVITTCVFH